MFDSALLESQKGRKGRGKGAGLPLAIGLHVLVIGALIGASTWSVGEPAEPVTIITVFPGAAALPPPPLGNGGHPRPPVAPPRSHEPVAAPNVTTMPADPRPEEVAEPEGPEYPGLDQIGLPGDSNGKPGGTGDEPIVGPGSGQVEGPRFVGGDVKAPVLVARIEPEYPESLRRAHIEGLVILEAVITANGAVEELVVLKSANPLLDRAVLEAVRQWRYRPATLNGRAVSVYLTVTVTFGLKS